MTIKDTWFDVYARAQLGGAVRAGLVLGMVLTLAALVPLGPLVAWVLVTLVDASGGPEVTGNAIAEFFGSPDGGLALLALLVLGLVVFAIGQAGLMHIAAGAGRGQTPSWADALGSALAILPRLFGIGWAALPLIVVTLIGAASVVYGLIWLAAMPGAAPKVAAVAWGLGLLVGLMWLSVRGLLAFPVALYEGLRGRAALRRARDLLVGQGWRVLRLVLVNLLILLAVTLSLRWLTAAGVAALLGGVGVGPALVARTLLALLLVALIAWLIGLLVMVSTALMAMHLYLESRRIDGLSERDWARAARSWAGRSGLAAALLIVALALLLGGSGLSMQRQTEALGLAREVLVVAHRGGAGVAPENTLAALYQAISDQADMATVDVQETADGVVVLMHDANLSRVAGVATPVREANYADLRRADVGRWFSPAFRNEVLPSLTEALLVSQHRLPLCIELRGQGDARRLVATTVDLVLGSGCATSCVLTSSDPAVLAMVRAMAPALAIGLVVREPFTDLDALLARPQADVTVADTPATDTAVGETHPDEATVGEEATGTRLDPDLISIEHRLLTRAQLEANRAAGIATHVGTVNEPFDMTRFIDWGVDAIITDQPARLRRLLIESAAMTDRQRLLHALGRRWRSAAGADR